MAAPPAGARLLDLQEAVAIRAQCSLPDVLRLHLASQLQLMTDTGLISVVNMQQLACSPAILQQYQQQQHLLTSLAAPHFSMPLATAAPSPWSFSNPGPSDIGDDAHTVHSFDSNLTSQSAMTTDAVLPPISTILGTAATNTDPFTCYPSTSSASQSLQQTQDSPFSLDTVHATTATAADNMLHFTPSLLSQADCDLIVPSTLPITQHAATNLNTQRVHSHVQVCPQVFPALDTPTLSNTTAPSSWGFDGTEELLAELVDLDALEQLLPAAPTGADGDISHTKNFAELGRAFDQAINASAEPMDTLASWQSSLGMAQPQLDLGLPTCSVAQPDFVTKPQPLDTNKPGLAALDNLVAFGMEDCSNPMPLCRSQPQDFRGSCITQSYTSYRTTAPTALRVTPTTPADPTQTPVCLKRSPTLEKADSRPLSRPGKRRCNVTGNVDPHAKDPSHVCLPVCKRSKATRPLSAIAENERRRVANMSPTRAEHVRQLAREATRRRKNRQRQTMKQLQRAVVELELKQRGLVGEQASLEKERQRLYTLVRKQNTKMVSC
eukprot:m.41856 g.41856  ORF g.41856 m.41856 type:complete len:551 (+) comp12844_c0_seq42:176-1828(+)